MRSADGAWEAASGTTASVSLLSGGVHSEPLLSLGEQTVLLAGASVASQLSRQTSLLAGETTLLPGETTLLSWESAELTGETTLLSWEAALLSWETTLLSWETGLLSWEGVVDAGRSVLVDGRLEGACRSAATLGSLLAGGAVGPAGGAAVEALLTGEAALSSGEV